MNRRSKIREFVISILVASALLIAAIYTDYIKNLPIIIQAIVIVLLAAVTVRFNNVFDYIDEAQKNYRLQKVNKALKAEGSERSLQLANLRTLMVSFMEHSHIYREKVKNRLRLNEDFICIAKSSEGLSDVFNSLEKKRPLPFTRVLMDIPGSIRPFERMGLFLIPIKSLPGIKNQPLREYIDAEIIPKVVAERERFLNGVPKSVARKADDLSFKYIAFLVSRSNIAQDVRNRKFNKSFNVFIVSEQLGADFTAMKSELAGVIKTKELLRLVDWKTFAELNREQGDLIEYYKEKINTSFTENEIDGLNALSKLDYKELQNLLWPIMRRKSTERRVANLSKKIIDGSRATIQTLKENGVNF